MLEKIRVVLIETSHPGNIGAVARAMKTMGLSRLYLVKPKEFPHPKAFELASNADDVLESAIKVETLEEAIADCQVVIGASTRAREISLPSYDARTAAINVIDDTQNNEVAILFGSERYGLSNQQLMRCSAQIMIPANPDYSSLNLAQAVQVICYELRMAWLTEKPLVVSNEDYATAEQLELFYQHLATVLTMVNFYNPKNPRRLLPRLKRLFARTKLEKMEVNILRGMLRSLQVELSKR